MKPLGRRGHTATQSRLRRPSRLAAALVLAAIVALASAVAASADTAPATTDLPTQSSAYNAAWQLAPTGYSAPANDGLGVGSGKIGHVWVIVLENHAYDAAFTPLEGTENTYVQNLPSQGALLTNYYGIGHSSQDNYMGMVSGQAPMTDTQDDCPSYDQMSGTIDTSGTLASNADLGQFQSAAGPNAPSADNGCVYPSSVKTIFNQLDSDNKSWKLYAQDVDPTVNTPASGQNAGIADCGAPESTVKAAPTASANSSANSNNGSANANSQYIAYHNPLGWFDSMLPASMGGTGGSDCANNLAPLFGANDKLYSDLQSESTTPALSFIVPNNCNNGHDAVCKGNNLSGEAAGYPTYNTASTIPAAASTDTYTGGTYAESMFLGVVIPEIEASPAFKDNGLIVVTYDEAYPPFAYTNDSQETAQMLKPDAVGDLTTDSAGETLYGRSLSWEPTGPNVPIITAPSGQVLSGGPGDSAYIDRPTTADGDLVACSEPSGSGNGNGTYVPFTSPSATNGVCLPGPQANGLRAATTTQSITAVSGSATVTAPGITPKVQGDQVTAFGSSTPTLTDGTNTNYTGSVYIGSVTETANHATTTNSSSAYIGGFTLVDSNGNPVTFNSAYSGTLSLASGDTSTDPFYDAFDATTGGGDSGAVLISKYITPGTVSNTYYNHYSLLRSLEDIYGLPQAAAADTSDATLDGVADTGYLGAASQPGLAPFGTDVFTNATTPQTTTVTSTVTTPGATQTVTSQGATQTVVTPGSTQTVTTASATPAAQTVTTAGKTRTVTDVKSVVPYLAGDTLSQARSLLGADKLRVAGAKGTGVVVAVSPRTGTQVKTGTAVTLTLRKKK